MPTAIVNGGTRGIGAAIVHSLQENEWDVHALGRKSCDARDTSQVRDYAHQVKTIDLLVNVAGEFRSSDIVNENPIELVGLIHTNLLGYWNWTHAVLPKMRLQGQGYIINISSMAAKRVRAGCSSYAITKAGVNALTKATLKENVHYRIRATAICPGDCDTQIGHQIAHYAELIPVDDIAKTVMWLLSLSKTSIVPEVCIERRGRYQ